MANAAEIANSIMRRKTQRKRELTLLGIAAIMVIACVVAWLHVDGIATTGEAMCGFEEHTHTADCYELVYTCGYEEGQVVSPEIDYAAIEAEVRSQFEAEVAAQREVYEVALQEAQDVAAAEAEAAGEDPEAAREAVAAAAEPAPVLDEVALQEAIDTAYAEAEAATEVHTHSEACAEARLVCDIPEHTHVPLCYSNPTIDVETPSEWEATFTDVERTGQWGADTLAIAETQIGYTESEQNFQLGDDGEHHGYTRYGDWYQNPYGSWDGLFVMFCLEYAGVDTDYLPCESGAYAWTAALQRASAYEPARAYTPKPGDVVFFNDDYETTDKANRVGIVKSVNDDLDELIVIEGDVHNTVAEAPYNLSSETIQGYCDVAARQAAAEDPNNGVVPIDEYGVEHDGQHETDQNADNEAGDEVDADVTDKVDVTDKNDEADKPTSGEKSDLSTPPTGTKTDGEDCVTADESGGSAAPTPSDESEPSKVIPMYATIVNDNGEIVVFSEFESQALADETTSKDGSPAQNDGEPPAEDALRADEASPADASKHDGVSQGNGASVSDKTRVSEDVQDNAAQEATGSLTKAPAAPQNASDLRGIEEANTSSLVTPLDMGTYLTDGVVEYQPIHAQEDAWTAVSGNNTVLNWDDTVKITLDYKLAPQTLSQLDTTVATQVQGIAAVERQKGDVLDELFDTELGAYEISEDGTIVIAFNEDTVKQNAEHAIEGAISFECDASAVAVNADNQATIQFGPMEPVTFTVVQEVSPEGDKKDGESGVAPDSDSNAVIEEPGKSEEFTEFVFTKIDGETHECLNGAKFEVYGYNRESQKYENIGNEVTSGGVGRPDGEVKIPVKYDTAYYMIETEAPDGYDRLVDESGNPIKIYFDVKRDGSAEGPTDVPVGVDEQNEAPSDTTGAYPEDYAFSDTLLIQDNSQGNSTYVLANYKPGELTSIMVKKVWIDDDNNMILEDDTAALPEIKVQLWQRAIVEVGDTQEITHEKLGEPVVLSFNNANERWAYTFKDLPLQGHNAAGKVVSYEYFVKESSSASGLYTFKGMTVQDTTNQNIALPLVANDDSGEADDDASYASVTGVTQGTITITNQYHDPGYELAPTGGVGVLPSLIGGSLLVIVAGAFALRRRRERELS